MTACTKLHQRQYKRGGSTNAICLNAGAVAFGLVVFLVASAAAADVYKYVDERGMVIFSTVPLAGKTPIAVIGADSPLPSRTPPVTHDRPRPGPSGGGVYKYKDDEGNIVLSTVPLPGKTPVAVIPAEPSQPLSSPGRTTNPDAGPSFKVSSDTQHGRDDLRRTILQDELTVEQRLLSTAAASYNDGQPVRLAEESANPTLYGDRVKRLSEEIRIHTSNIAALQRELSRIK
jgi:hypothetical protein